MPDSPIWLLVGVIAVVAGAVAWRLVRRRRADRELRRSLDQVDLQLNRRAELLINLVTTVCAVAAHERAVLEEAQAVREQILDGTALASVTTRAEAHRRLDAAVTDLLSIAEAYPDVAASPQFQAVRSEILAAGREAEAALAAYDEAAAGH